MNILILIKYFLTLQFKYCPSISLQRGLFSVIQLTVFDQCWLPNHYELVDVLQFERNIDEKIIEQGSDFRDHFFIQLTENITSITECNQHKFQQAFTKVMLYTVNLFSDIAYLE